MPVIWCYDVENGQQFCYPGFPIGCYVNSVGLKMTSCGLDARMTNKNNFYIFNHVDIIIEYHKVDEPVPGAVRLVQARISPRSIKTQVRFQKSLAAKDDSCHRNTLHSIFEICCHLNQFLTIFSLSNLGFRKN